MHSNSNLGPGGNLCQRMQPPAGLPWPTRHLSGLSPCGPSGPILLWQEQIGRRGCSNQSHGEADRLRGPGILPSSACGCSPRLSMTGSKGVSERRHSPRLLYSGNRDCGLFSCLRRRIGWPCRVRASLRGRRRSPQDGIRREGRTICSTAMSLRRPPQRADLPFPSSPARDIPPPGGGARRTAASAAARCFMRWPVVPTGTLFRWPTCDGG
jgi:hypothetical protein